MSVNLETVDEEYRRRFRWWLFVPPNEREEFAEAEAAHDLKKITRLQKRGRRRDKFGVIQTCSLQPTFSGITWGSPPGSEDCECAVVCLDSDALYRHLTNLELSPTSFPSAAASAAVHAFQQAAEWRHDNPTTPLSVWISKDKARRARFAAGVREVLEAKALAAETVTAPAPAEPPTPSVSPATVALAEPRLREKRVDPREEEHHPLVWRGKRRTDEGLGLSLSRLWDYRF